MQMTTLQERFLKYVSVWTTSDPENENVIPSTQRQWNLAHLLVKELKEMGVTDARTDEHGYVYGSIPATEGLEDVPAIGLIAHMDTSPECSGENVKPQIIENYNGEDVNLGTSGYVLKVSEFPHLQELKGRTLITTDGTTLLGADDKAGVAIVMEIVRQVMAKEFSHGKICIGFTPDEEIGSGAELFQLEEFGADYAYTLDGSCEGEIQFENFNAATAIFEVKGVNVHTGSAKNIMKNAQTIAMKIHSKLPAEETPECTEGYEGFYHLMSMEGHAGHACTKYLIRDFSAEGFDARADYLRSIEKEMNEIYGQGTVTLTIEESYRNMREKIEPCMQLVDYAKQACEMAGVAPIVEPIRGGTDGARLSFRGLPCPNLGTGGFGFHGVYEHITLEGMEQSVKIAKNILTIFAQK